MSEVDLGDITINGLASMDLSRPNLISAIREQWICKNKERARNTRIGSIQIHQENDVAEIHISLRFGLSKEQLKNLEEKFNLDIENLFDLE